MYNLLNTLQERRTDSLTAAIRPKYLPVFVELPLTIRCKSVFFSNSASKRRVKAKLVTKSNHPEYCQYFYQSRQGQSR